jgi:hypothetical protein
MLTRAQTLDKAKECVMVNRQATHGPPEDSFTLIAKFWSAYLGVPVRDYQVATMMSLLKIARSKFRPSYDDNYVDQAGYAACSAELATRIIPPIPPPDVIESFWKQPPPKMDAAGRAMYEADMAKHKNNPCTGESPAPLPSSVLISPDC